MLGGMAEFFAARLDGYDEHMRRDIDGAAAPGGLYLGGDPEKLGRDEHPAGPARENRD